MTYLRCPFTGKRQLTVEEADLVIKSKVRDFYNKKTGQRMNRMRRRAKETRKYLCECGYYHLTSMKKSEYKK